MQNIWPGLPLARTVPSGPWTVADGLVSAYDNRSHGHLALSRSRLSQQNDNVLTEQSRNVLLTESSLEGGQRTTTDDPSRTRPAGGPEKGQEEIDHAEASSRRDRRHRAAGAAFAAQVATERGPGGNPRTAWASVPSETAGCDGTASDDGAFRPPVPGIWPDAGGGVLAQATPDNGEQGDRAAMDDEGGAVASRSASCGGDASVEAATESSWRTGAVGHQRA